MPVQLVQFCLQESQDCKTNLAHKFEFLLSTGIERHHQTAKKAKYEDQPSKVGISFIEWQEELKALAQESRYIVEKYGTRPNLEEWVTQQEEQLAEGKFSKILLLYMYNDTRRGT